MPFRVPLELEAIGDDRVSYLRAARRGLVPSDPRREERALELTGGRRPWVAELTGLDARSGFARRFLVPKRDYRSANGVGSRGVWLCYLLDEGNLYEIHRLVTWKRSEHTYVRVVDGALISITQEGAIRCLSARLASASTS